MIDDVAVPVARFDDLRAGVAVQFNTADRIITTDRPADVLPALEAVDAAVRDGNWAFGFVSYDAAVGVDPQLISRRSSGSPLLWFGISADAPVDTELSALATSDYQVADWQPEWTAADHARRVRAVRAAIAAGDSYQCNLTTRLFSTFSGDPLGYYRDLAASQQGSHHAYVNTGDQLLISASPELFFSWSQDRLVVKPMKGTAPRGLTLESDEQARKHLLSSPKDRAENVMIVDLVRNDIARIARPGTVTVEQLATCEKYDTVWQLTSTVSGQTPPSTRLTEVFAALFPCGSITGAPKQRTMEIIAELETSPRGAYCGTIGYLEPSADRDHPRARFNVAIRTVVVERPTGAASYGVGSGITWGSTPSLEYDELIAKATLLRAPAAAFSLLETFAVRGGSPINLDHHLARIEHSARYFDVPFVEAVVRDRIALAAESRPDARARLAIARDGAISVTVSDLPPPDSRPVSLSVDTVPVDTGSRWVYHKTTMRQFIDNARRRHPDTDDVVLINASGLVTETMIANLAVRIDGVWCTPPVSDGCLPGIGRRLALERGELTERSITVEALYQADEIALFSSLRGRRDGIIARHGDRSDDHRAQPMPNIRGGSA